MSENSKTPEEKIANVQLAFGLVAESLHMYYDSLKMTGMPDDLIETLVIAMQTILMSPILGAGGDHSDE